MSSLAGGAARPPLEKAFCSTSPLGVAGFDPSFPGSPLVRVVDPDVARPLLEALVPHAPAGDEVLRVYVEGQPGVRDALVDAGGEVVMRVLRLEGHLP
jgi:hypothetical protein